MVSGPLCNRASSAAKSVRHNPAFAMLCSVRSRKAWWLRVITSHSRGPAMRRLLFIAFLLSGNLHPGPLTRRRQQAVDGSSSRAADHQKRGYREHQQVILEALSLLRPRPVHEEAELRMNHRNGYDHVAKDAESCEARKEAEDETQPAEEFSGNCQERE